MAAVLFCLLLLLSLTASFTKACLPKRSERLPSLVTPLVIWSCTVHVCVVQFKVACLRKSKESEKTARRFYLRMHATTVR